MRVVNLQPVNSKSEKENFSKIIRHVLHSVSAEMDDVALQLSTHLSLYSCPCNATRRSRGDRGQAGQSKMHNYTTWSRWGVPLAEVPNEPCVPGLPACCRALLLLVALVAMPWPSSALLGASLNCFEVCQNTVLSKLNINYPTAKPCKERMLLLLLQNQPNPSGSNYERKWFLAHYIFLFWVGS